MSRRSWAGALCAFAVVAGACSSAPPAPPGGIAYRWPPPATLSSGPPSSGRCCQLLVDDYQHLKSLSHAGSAGGKTRVARDFVAFGPTLEAAAPAGIAPAVGLYLGSVTALVSALVRADFNVLKVPPPILNRLSDAAVSAAAAQVIDYSSRQCHYDLQANSAPNG